MQEAWKDAPWTEIVKCICIVNNGKGEESSWIRTSMCSHGDSEVRQWSKKLVCWWFPRRREEISPAYWVVNLKRSSLRYWQRVINRAPVNCSLNCCCDTSDLHNTRLRYLPGRPGANSSRVSRSRETSRRAICTPLFPVKLDVDLALAFYNFITAEAFCLSAITR